MRVLQGYDSNVFNSLPDFRMAHRSLSMHKASLRELGQVICRHDLQNQAGISLLHNHFHISPDEQLVKEFVGNKAYIRPYAQPDNDKIVPYLWKCATDQATGALCFYPLEFVDTTHRAYKGRVDAETMLQAEAFLVEIATMLQEAGIENVFGISTLHSIDEITLDDDEILLETTDHTQRTLTLSPTVGAQLDMATITETTWQFTAVTDGEAIVECNNHCIKHCDDHSKE